MAESKLTRLIGISLGLIDKLSINLKAIYHGHYHKEDLIALEQANSLIYKCRYSNN